MARKAPGCVVVMKQSRVTVYRSIYDCMARKLNSPHHLFSDCGATFLDQVLRFLYRGTQKTFIGHFGHIQGQAHVGLFQLYLTSLPCHSSRHVENLQEISCCFKQWDSAITSTIYASVACSKVIRASFVYFRGCLAGNMSPNITALKTS